MRPWVAALRPRGVDARALDLPKSNPARAVEVFRAALAESPGAAIGGHSYGGRMASLLAAEQTPASLVLLSYPLHRPGHPEELRIEHWPSITCPVLLLSGERDPFARIDLLRSAVARLPLAELRTWPGVGHGVLPVVDEAADAIAAFLAEDPRPAAKVSRGR
jgi:uncharacterized protein